MNETCLLCTQGWCRSTFSAGTRRMFVTSGLDVSTCTDLLGNLLLLLVHVLRIHVERTMELALVKARVAVEFSCKICQSLPAARHVRLYTASIA